MSADAGSGLRSKLAPDTQPRAPAAMRIREGREGRVFALATYAGARRRARCWVKQLSENVRGFTLSFVCVAVVSSGSVMSGIVAS